MVDTFGVGASVLTVMCPPGETKQSDVTDMSESKVGTYR